MDKLYQRVDVDKVTGQLENLALPTSPKTKERYLFTVKIVEAQNLLPNDSSSKLDTFITLSDENGYHLAKTRTIYNALEPRSMCLSLRNVSLALIHLVTGSQEFDFSVDSSLWLMASVQDRALIGKHIQLAEPTFVLTLSGTGIF